MRNTPFTLNTHHLRCGVEFYILLPFLKLNLYYSGQTIQPVFLGITIITFNDALHMSTDRSITRKSHIPLLATML